jgi:hypothetical protein
MPFMTWIRNVTTGHHQQDTDYYCGAAVAQMILDSIGSGLLDQNVLYNSNHSHNTQSGWYTDPDGLNYTLNFYKPNPPTFNNFFVTYAKDTEPEGSEKIVYTLWRYSVSTGTLVYGCGHWIVVRGLSTDVEPSPGNTYTINGFWINNPWPPTPSFSNPAAAPPPPHSSGDMCGSGGNRGIANEYVTYTSWKDTYFTGCDVWGVGHSQYVSVCDPEPPKLGKLNMGREEFEAKGDHIISTEEAGRFAIKGIDKHGLRNDELFAKALEGANPINPILVQRLDLPDTFYYLVPMTRNDEVTAFLSVDGLYGNFRGAQVLDKPVRTPFVDRDRIIEKLLGQPVDLGEKIGRVVIREGAFCFYPIMVWRPCLESRSPYYPFYMITVGSRNIYVGYDGTIYSQLHEMGRGA